VGDPFYLFIIRRTLTAGLAVSGLSLLIGYSGGAEHGADVPSRRSLLLMGPTVPPCSQQCDTSYGWIAILGPSWRDNTCWETSASSSGRCR